MKQYFITLLGILGLSLYTNGQTLHTPDEITKIIKKSITYYDFQKDKNVAQGKMLDILANDYYFQISDEKEDQELDQYSLEADPKLYSKYLKAHKYQTATKYKKARKTYNKLLKTLPNHAGFMTQIGWTYFYENNNTEAVKWANKALRTNHIHYPAYVLLTNIYLKSQKIDEAMATVTKAHLLNRNDRKIILLLKKVYVQKRLIYDDSWAFVKEYEMTKKSDNKIDIRYNGEPWRAYAACQAMWEYEPYYKQKMVIVNEDEEGLRYHEALLNMAIAYENWGDLKHKKKFNMGKALQKAVKEQMIQEFILYEINLAENPKLGFYFSEDEINTLAKYILTVKSLKIPENKQIGKEH